MSEEGSVSSHHGDRRIGEIEAVPKDDQKELSNHWRHAFAYSNAATREERDSLSCYYRNLPPKEIPTDTLYSNEFSGGVNRWQFSKRVEE